MSYHRPAFWRVPRNEDHRGKFIYNPQTFDDQQQYAAYRKKVHFNDDQQVNHGSPAYGEVLRGDVISKIGDYDSRDIRHDDAQMLFRNAGNKINLVVQRDNKIAYQPISNGASPAPSTIPAHSPFNPISPAPQSYNSLPHRAPSPLPPGPGSYAAALNQPVASLPHTMFPKVNASGGYVSPAAPPRSSSRNSVTFSPMPTRDYQHEYEEEIEAILNQPYRTTPLILPGAKVKKDNLQTESYLRHHPNPAVRANHIYEYHDAAMKQKVADTVLNRVVGDEAKNGKVVHKQFNSPIGLYSDQNIENTIKQTVPYKQTVVYDPSKSETFRAVQEAGGDYIQEIPVPVQHKVYSPNRLVPGKKPTPHYPPAQPHFNHNINNLGESADTIHQSGSFKRLMYSVLGETTY